jgi:hypothetical protein
MTASFSQTDPKWANDKHGTSNYTLRQTGCTITALASLLSHYGVNETPRTVNQKLTQNNGYLNGNLLIWSAIPKIWPNMRFVERLYSYDNNRVRANLPCLVEVSMPQAPGGKHWIIFRGGGQMIDPLDGKTKPTSTYTPTGAAIIRGEVVSNPGTMPETALQECLKQHTQLVTELEAEKRKNTSLVEESQKKDQEIQRLKGEVAEKSSALKTVRDELSQFIETLASKLSTIADKSEVIGAVDRLITNEDAQEKKIRQLEKSQAVFESEKKEEIADLKKSIEKLREQNDAQIKQIQELSEQNQRLSERLEMVSERLEQFEQGNTPPSSERTVFELLQEVYQRVLDIFRRSK